MKRFIAVVEGMLLSLFFSVFALAAPNEHLDWGQVYKHDVCPPDARLEKRDRLPVVFARTWELHV